MSDGLKNEVLELITEPIRSEGYEIAELKLAIAGVHSSLKLFVYGEKGVTLDECARLSRLVGDILEPVDMFKQGYKLEVSSPGLDRPLTTVTDFKYRVGEKVSVTFADPKQKGIEAEIVAVENNQVSLASAGNTLAVDISEIKNAQIVF